jgi:hypothetical protein
MESPDEVGGDEVNELFALTGRLEHWIQTFTFTGNRVSGGVQEGGFTVQPRTTADEE